MTRTGETRRERNEAMAVLAILPARGFTAGYTTATPVDPRPWPALAWLVGLVTLLVSSPWLVR